MLLNCPRCESSNIQKKGTRAGRQRYRCNDCGANFSEGVPYVPAVKLEKISGVTCPKCGCTEVTHDGKLPKGTLRYRCTNCKTRFSDVTATLMEKYPSIKWTCPYCGGRLKYSGYTANGNHSYMCRDCGKSCSADDDGKPIEHYIFSETNTTITCPECNSLDLKKAGYASNGRARYLCRKCNTLFTYNPLKKRHSKEDHKKAIHAILNGHNINKVAAKYEYSPRQLRRIMEPYYEKEKVSKSQINDIIKFGYYLKVPVDYMAEYIHCSEHKCRSILKEYADRQKRTKTSEDSYAVLEGPLQ